LLNTKSKSCVKKHLGHSLLCTDKAYALKLSAVRFYKDTHSHKPTLYGTFTY